MSVIYRPNRWRVYIPSEQLNSDGATNHMGALSNLASSAMDAASMRRFHFSCAHPFTFSHADTANIFYRQIFPSGRNRYLTFVLTVIPVENDNAILISSGGVFLTIPGIGASAAYGLRRAQTYVVQHDMSTPIPSMYNVAFSLTAGIPESIRAVTCYEAPMTLLESTDTEWIDMTPTLSGAYPSATLAPAIMDVQDAIIAERGNDIIANWCSRRYASGGGALYNTASTAWYSLHTFTVHPCAQWSERDELPIKVRIRAQTTNGDGDVRIVTDEGNSTAQSITTSPDWYDFYGSIDPPTDYADDWSSTVEIQYRDTTMSDDIIFYNITIQQQLEDSGYPTPVFQAFDVSDATQLPSISRLGNTLTVGGSDYTASAAYSGADASETGWPSSDAGRDLAISAQTERNTYSRPTPTYGVSDGSVRFGDVGGSNFPDRFEATGAQMDPSSTNKVLVIELVARLNPHTTGRNFFSRNNHSITATTHGWSLSAYSTGNLYWAAGDGTNNDYIRTFSGVCDDLWRHYLMVYRDNGDTTATIYTAVNGNRDVYQTSVGPIGDITPSTPADANTRIGWSGHGCEVAWVATWAPEIATITAADWDECAEERFLKLTGVWPHISTGTAAPTSWGRASSAQLRIDHPTEGVRFFGVGSNWLRIERHEGDTGLVLESTVQNELADSCDLSQWSILGDAIAVDGYDGPYTSASYISVSDTDVVYDTAAAATFSDGDPVAIGFAYKRNATSGTLRVQTTGQAGAAGQWDIDVSALPDRWVWIDRASPYISVTTEWAAADNGSSGLSFRTPSGTVDGYVAMCQIQDTGDGYCDSPVYTSGGTASRSTEPLYFKGDDGNCPTGARSIVAGYLAHPARATDRAIIGISDGGAATDQMTMWVNYSDGTLRGNLTSSPGANGYIGTSSRVDDGSWQHGCYTLSNNDARIWVNGAQEGQDTSVNVPINLDRIYIGGGYSGGSKYRGGMLRNIRIFSEDPKKCIP